jgi:hypothetical protein
MVKKISKEIYLAILFVIVILWQMLLPGYLLTLDMVFTPRMNTPFGDGSFYNSLPLRYLSKFLNLFLDGWIIQKIFLIALFFCLFYLALKYLPVTKKYYAHYWSAIFYTINPFVYERFLAGHWTHLFAYALLPLFISNLFQFAKKPNWRKSAYLCGSLILIGIFSLHFLVMAILILSIYLFSQFVRSLIAKKYNFTKNILKFCLIFGFIFLICSSYWLVPYLLNRNQSIITEFNQQNIEAFKTSGDARLGTGLNVLALYGFWNENQPWANYWLWPKDNFTFWSIIASILLIIISLGIFFGLKHQEYRAKTIFFLVLGLLAFIFSCGIGNTVFKPFNQLLFDYIFFWRGFRDTQKFTGLLALSYAYLASLGFYYLIAKLKKFNIDKFALIVLFALPLLYTYPMLGGFARQVQPIWYPESWQRVNQLLRRDISDYKVLFLPWHQYFSLDFNNKLISANPATSFFGSRIIQSLNLELDNLLTQSRNQKNNELTEIIQNKSHLTSDQIIEQLINKKIKYIILTPDLKNHDIFNYEFLSSARLWTTFNSPEINLYQIQGF